MASGVVRAAVSSALDKDAFRLESSRIKILKQYGTEFLEKIICGEKEMRAFDNFSSNVIAILKAIIESVTKTDCSLATKRGKLWADFHVKRQVELPELWKNVF